MPAISPGRLTALKVLGNVAEGAYASDALLSVCNGLEPRDAGLAAQIVFGVLRYQAQLDYLIQRYSRREAAGLDLPVLIALRTGIFQLRYLDRIPPHAAVHETVEFVKGKRRPAAAFTNAVLRKVNRAPVAWPDDATALSCPRWLMDRWAGRFGLETAHEIAKAALAQPAVYIRNPPEGLAVTATEVPGCFRVEGELPAGIRTQDIGSQSLVPVLELRPGMSYLDVCAAPGNKTLQALETPLSLAVACDISLKRLRTVPDVCPRVAADAERGLPFGRKFDRVLVDAPCSGTGTLSRNPEIKWRVQAQDFSRFQRKQVRILLRAAEALTPCGRLVYATCSLEAEENDRVVKAALEENARLRCAREHWRIPGRDAGDGFYAAVFEHAAA